MYLLQEKHEDSPTSSGQRTTTFTAKEHKGVNPKLLQTSPPKQYNGVSVMTWLDLDLEKWKTILRSDKATFTSTGRRSREGKVGCGKNRMPSTQSTQRLQ